MKRHELNDMLLSSQVCVFEEDTYFLVELRSEFAQEAMRQSPRFIDEILLVFLDAQAGSSPAHPIRATQLGDWSDRPSTDAWHALDSTERPSTDEYARLTRAARQQLQKQREDSY